MAPDDRAAEKGDQLDTSSGTQLFCLVKWWGPEYGEQTTRINNLALRLNGELEEFGYYICKSNGDIHCLDFTHHPDDMLPVYMANSDILCTSETWPGHTYRTWFQIYPTVDPNSVK